ncbi:FAD-binding oxidoreductase [Kitasatospora camelliae]|uniref:FAD-binding oxidoreductase n=1 Tax=Kitasatospora camelliae TaxID=3156397 RepID=A0AAU8JU85_9ACTN
MTSEPLDSRSLEELRSAIAGEVIGPGDASYDESRAVFNAMIDRRPAVIAQCTSTADVASALAFARARGLEVAVRGGGHAVSGTAMVEGGLVVDLRRMNTVRVDPDARVARAGGGATIGDLDRATQPHGLATTGGRASTTGLGGFVLGGGSGWVERKFGLACDNLLAAQVVTADGRTVRAGAQENPELFWALHGGGGNFGVVTEFTLGLHPLPGFAIALLLYEAEAGRELAHRYRDFMAAAPDEVGGGLIYLTAPPEEFVPDHLVGQLATGLLLTYTDDLATARPHFAPMLENGHAGGVITDIPYADLQCMIDDPPGFRNYWSAEYLADFPDEAVDLYCDRASDMVVPSGSQHAAVALGGAVSRVEDDYPVPWRRAAWAVHPFGMWEDPADDARGRAWANAACADLKPWSIGAVYLNFIGDEGSERTAAGLGEGNLARLAQIKAEWDPDNVFHLNHNIRPA